MGKGRTSESTGKIRSRLGAEVMNEDFDPAELRAVALAMREFKRRCDAIAVMLQGKTGLRLHEREELRTLYEALKRDLKAAAKNGTLSGSRTALSRAEQCFYDPAVRRAAIDLRPATNSHPLNGNWMGARYEAGSEFSYYLHNVSGIPGSEE